MYLYDSLSTKNIKLEDIIKNNTLNIYTCGPTVYDFVHIGNARPLILTDLIIKLAKYKNIKINYLLNITDIDDKIIDKAISISKSENEVANFFYEKFINDFDKLNITKPNKILKVTENIDKFISYINVLIEKKIAYISEGNVFFSVNKIKNYGELSKNNLKKLINISDIDNIKQNNLDFALWKKTVDGIKWNSKWSKGRPGWHLECAVFIDYYFKNELDIHVGGVDLKFPHHENERAIYFAKNNKEIAKIWLHNGLLNINNQKMSKSLNNSHYLKDFINKYNSNTLKYIFYTKRFLQPLNINEELINFAIIELKKITNMLMKFHEIHHKIEFINDKNEDIIINDLFDKFIFELNNNLNTANALEIIKIFVKKINKLLKINKMNKNLYKKLKIAINIFGFDFSDLNLKI